MAKYMIKLFPEAVGDNNKDFSFESVCESPSN